MKKITIVAALIFTTGILSSCSKENSVQPTRLNKAHMILANDKKDLGSGD